MAPRLLGSRRRNLTARIAASLPETEVVEHSVGAMNVVCNDCAAQNFLGEKTAGHFNICCSNGKVSLPNFRPLPQLIQDLLAKTHPRRDWVNSFSDHIRGYNGCLAFASMNARLDSSVIGGGSYCYRIHGQVYHATSTLYPDDMTPQFAQIYIMDSNQAEYERERQRQAYTLEADLFRELEILMLQVNPYALSFRMMRDVEREEARNARLENRPLQKVRMYMLSDRSADIRRFNPARANEIAAVFVSQDGMAPPCCTYDLTIFPRSIDVFESLPPEIAQNHERVPRTNLIRISRANPNCDAMVYPLLFPSGDQGYRPNIPHTRGGIYDRVTLREYYSFILQHRLEVFPAIQLSGKLYHQFLVDAYTKAEGNNLHYIRTHQSDLRVHSYQGLMDYVRVEGMQENVRVGRRVILPSSYPGSPRAMQQHYQDAMAIVRELGKPDLFVTFTCNPNWPEIVASLHPNQSPQDRPDIVSRVFNLKLNSLLDDFLKKDFFGKVTGYCYTVEFQKRGLPHAHILLILRDADKIRDADTTNLLVSAELPDEQESPRTYELVTSHMMHGPCGLNNPSCPCMVNEECSKKFPKDFSPTTIYETNGYPRYMRRETGRFCVKRGVQLNNQWVVPYNRTLLLKYNAHINVEVCASIKSVKYLYKYIYKGHDCAMVAIVRDGVAEVDEITTHLNARYVSASEASWRLFSFKLHNQSHAIVRLAVHLENMQQTFFVEGEEARALENAQRRSTTLLHWFELNARDPQARAIKYSDIVDNYVYNRQSGWTRRRRRSRTLARMYFVSPKETERFNLRLLLLHVAGAQSFADLRTFQGIIYETFQLAAIARGIANSDQEWDQCLQEASLFGMPHSLRHLFATILAFCNPSNASELFENHKLRLAEDYLRTNDQARAIALCLRDIQNILLELNTSLSNFGLLVPNIEDDDNDDIQQETENMSRIILNERQSAIYDAVFAAASDDSIVERRFFVDGPGGSGKTTLYKKIIADLIRQDIPYLAVASTGIASTLLPGGRTAHSAFKLPLNLNETSVSSLSCRSQEAEKLRRVKVIIWDEVTMVSAEALRVVNDLLKDITSSGLLFGNKVIVLGGDFRQCLPIVRRGTRQMIIEACIKSSHLWRHFVPMSLSVNMRAAGDAEFSNWLLRVGSGSPDSTLTIPPGFISSPALINDIFGTDPNGWTAGQMQDKCILSPKNDDIAVINERVLSLLTSEERIYLSSDSVDVREGDNPSTFPTEFLNSLTPSGFPPHRLHLKIGCIIILLRNLDPKNGLYNGTRLIVRRFAERSLICSPLYNENKVVLIPRIDLSPTDSLLPFTLHRRQFPVRLSYAMSINKSQGQTFGRVGLYLPKPVFAHGQLYVALSRVRTRNDIKIQLCNDREQGIDQVNQRIFTKNIVYSEVLQ